MNTKHKKLLRGTLKTILWIAGIWFILLTALELVLSQSMLTGLVNRYAAEYVDGTIRFGKVSASMFRRFPSVTLTLEDFSITYPADRFDASEKSGVQGHLMYSGCADEADTLASFGKFTASLNLPALVTGTIHIPYLRLDKPRIFAHAYADGKANWNIFDTGASTDSETEDSTGTSPSLPRITLGRIGMTGRPHIVYTDSRDTVFAMVNVKRIGFNGKINTSKAHRNRVGLSIDSMAVAGRLGRDTMAAGIDRLYLHEHNRHMDADMSAKAFMATRAFGRMMIPVEIKGILSLPKDTVPALKAEDMTVEIAHVPVKAQADIRFRKDVTSIRAKLGIEDCSIRELLETYAGNIMPELKKISTDARLGLDVTCEGDYNHITGTLPEIKATLNIPASQISHEDISGHMLALSLNAAAGTSESGDIDIFLNEVTASTDGAALNLKGDIKGLMSADPLVNIDTRVCVVMDSLAAMLPDSLGIKAKGDIKVTVKGSSRVSQLNIYNFSKSSLTGEISGDGIDVAIPSDTVSAAVDGLHIVLGPEEKSSRKEPSETFRLMGITGKIAKADIAYGKTARLMASDLRIAAKNVMDTQTGTDTSKRIYPFGGSISAGKLSLKDASGSVIRLDSTWNGFQILPKKDNPRIPMLTLNSRNNKIFLKSDVNRVMLAGASLRADAALNTVERRQKAKAFRDSLARVYPDIPKDSLFIHMMAQKGPRPEMPEWMKEEDFRKQDIDISLDKNLAKYFRDWDIKGMLSVRSGMVITPYFPLRNSLQGFDLKFTNDRISIDRFKVRSGDSDISAAGQLTGLKRALLGRQGALKLDVDVTSQGINANQLMKAYRAGCSFSSDSFHAKENVSDEEYLAQVTATDTVMAENVPQLIVIPANLNAGITLNASDIKYSDLHIGSLTAEVAMKERCVQITGTEAQSNMGEISLEGFYATQSKKDLKAGFSLNFKDITAEKVIGMMPAIDTIMPLLKSFGGLLDCELAATAQLDTNMNLIMPSINGIIRIGGENLTISENDMFRSVAKLLMFRNKKEGRIDKMTVEGVIKDSRLEVFPFILEMDRYTLGLSGVQNMDMSFRYHASLIKSPFLIKLGIDLYGTDFDNMKFKLGRAKYKNRNVPVFSTVIDRTKVNLVESIRNIFDKGVDEAIRSNAAQEAIEEHRKKIGYIQAVDQKLEELSAEEQRQLEEERNKEETTDEQSAVHRSDGEDNTVQ